MKEARANEGRMKQGGIPAPGPEVKARAQAGEARAQARAPARAATPVASRPPVDADLASEEDTRASYRIIPKAREEVDTEASETETEEIDWGKTVTIGEGRELQSIPSATEESAPAAKKAAAAPAKATLKKAAAAAPAKSPARASALFAKSLEKPEDTEIEAGIADQISKIEDRLSKIEERLAAIEERLDQT
ncbi:MAG TPA: hypothetical protein VKM55_00900 [Candidatus Lokiarchaeia archaeon]|nr:hypothetical protein [Candidatus Lokiarchaeia archaeon]